MRGWAPDIPNISSPLLPQDSDGEEPWTDDDESQRAPDQPVDSSEYKETNNMLHEIHALNQHRLLFVNPPPTPGPSTYASPALNSLPYQLAHTSEQSHPYAPLAAHKLNNFSHLPVHPIHPPRFEMESHLQVGAQHPPQQDDRQEVQWVRERYEDANRLLGSLFLSRRRELFPADEGPTYTLPGR